MLILLQQLTQDIRFGLRTFVRTPGFTTLAVLSLALGIMATTAMYSVIHAVVLDPFPYKDVDALMSVRVWSPGQRGYRTNYSTDQFLEIADRNTIFEGTIASTISDVLWTEDGDPQRLRGNHGTPNTFQVMGVPALLGRTYLPDDGRADAAPVVVLGFRFWQRQFGGDTDGRRPSAPPQRHGPDSGRGHAEAVHVARRRCLPAGDVRTRDASSRASETFTCSDG